MPGCSHHTKRPAPGDLERTQPGHARCVSFAVRGVEQSLDPAQFGLENREGKATRVYQAGPPSGCRSPLVTISSHRPLPGHLLARFLASAPSPAVAALHALRSSDLERRGSNRAKGSNSISDSSRSSLFRGRRRVACDRRRPRGRADARVARSVCGRGLRDVTPVTQGPDSVSACSEGKISTSPRDGSRRRLVWFVAWTLVRFPFEPSIGRLSSRHCIPVIRAWPHGGHWRSAPCGCGSSTTQPDTSQTTGASADTSSTCCRECS